MIWADGGGRGLGSRNEAKGWDMNRTKLWCVTTDSSMGCRQISGRIRKKETVHVQNRV
jgi:hypothetical protein